jgi:hypothetical protein
VQVSWSLSCAFMSTIHLSNFSLLLGDSWLSLILYCRNWRRRGIFVCNGYIQNVGYLAPEQNVRDPQSMLLNWILLRYRYEKYAQKNGWKFDVIDIMESAVKGYKVQPLSLLPNFCLYICACFFTVAQVLPPFKIWNLSNS